MAMVGDDCGACDLCLVTELLTKCYNNHTQLTLPHSHHCKVDITNMTLSWLYHDISQPTPYCHHNSNADSSSESCDMHCIWAPVGIGCVMTHDVMIQIICQMQTIATFNAKFYSIITRHPTLERNIENQVGNGFFVISIYGL